MTLIKPEEHSGDGGSETTVKVRTPKRILHFSDGVLEEYSDDEVDNTPKEEQTVVDPFQSTLTWGPWFWYKTWRAGASTLYIVDSVGEWLAAFFGITTPKYYFELEQYKEREAALKAEKEQSQGWSEPSQGENMQLNNVTTNQPKPEPV